jgi:hypothetical protein
MTEPRFPYEQSEWHCGESERWLQALERYGPENVRAVLYGLYKDTSSRADVAIGTTQVTKGFAQEWLAWHDRQKSNQDTKFRTDQIYWTRRGALSATAAAIAASVAAAAAAMGGASISGAGSKQPRHVTTAEGGQWHAAQVARVRSRLS